MIQIIKDQILLNPTHEKPILWDARFKQDGIKKPIIIFIHGFKGFKDWGTFSLLADHFAAEDFVFVKFNLSHNGTTPESPLDFADLEAFGNNNFSIELDDLGLIIDHFSSENKDIPAAEVDYSKVYLIGHSRGGGLAFLKANEDARIKAVASWAGISDLKSRYPKEVMEQWRQEGVQYVYNSRTGQNMPLYYQMVEDFERNTSRFSISEALKKMNIPLLFIHGTKDETLPLSMAHDLKSWNPQATLKIIEGANHTFGGTHPYSSTEVPPHLQIAVQETVNFFKGLS